MGENRVKYYFSHPHPHFLGDRLDVCHGVYLVFD